MAISEQLFTKSLIRIIVCYFIISPVLSLKAETGYRLWLRYDLVQDAESLNAYRTQLQAIDFNPDNEILRAAESELLRGLKGLLGAVPNNQTNENNVLLLGTRSSSSRIREFIPGTDLQNLGDGFLIRTVNKSGVKYTIIASEKPIGTLYGTFYFLKLLQSHKDISELNVRERPAIMHRVLNHWDNLDGSVERGYAGASLWNWHKLPGYTETRYTDYARANASIGINGTVLNNVNANSLALTPAYLQKAASLADVFRPYGIKVYLSARFSAPVEIGGLKTADPLDPDVKLWWAAKAKEIYQYIPDFGGFLVKANSEGQPGPQNYGRNHADGANMLADALKPHNGIVMWRAFVYDNEVPVDRAIQSFNEFKPLDGQFRDNVLVQVKNGPIDFQPREPFHPLFGKMPATPLMMEFQITQEYLGLSTNLVYLGTLFEETLKSETYAKGKGSFVSNVIRGETDGHSISGIAGVANTGSDVNWTGHPFGQANWYSFGRLAWNPDLTAADIAEEWIRQTFSNDLKSIKLIKTMMMGSREAAVNYMTPLGLHHIMARNHHWGPGPWVKEAGRADWTSVYYHRADSLGIGFDRTVGGSNYVSQYHPEVAAVFNNRKSISDDYLLFFHRVRWDERMNSGKTLWDELVNHYYLGVNQVKEMQTTWDNLAGHIDEERFNEVKQLLQIQFQEAVWWRDACLLYFQSHSKLPIPSHYEQPKHNLEYYKNLKFYFVPGI